MKTFGEFVRSKRPIDFFVTTYIHDKTYDGVVSATSEKQAKTKFIARILRRLGYTDKQMSLAIAQAKPYTKVKLYQSPTVNTKPPTPTPPPDQSEFNF